MEELLREKFHRAAKTIIDAFQNVPEICTYHEIGYDDSGQGSVGDKTTIPNLKVIREDFEVEKVDGSAVLEKDRRYMVAALDLLGVTPEEDDTLEFSIDDVWTVHRVSADPACAAYYLHVRR